VKISRSRRTPISQELHTFPHRLALARKVAEMGSTELDAAAGVAVGRTSRAEAGERVDGLPLDTVIKFARALRVRPSWLAFGEGTMLSENPESVPESSVRSQP
jgi:hypothetical protein